MWSHEQWSQQAIDSINLVPLVPETGWMIPRSVPIHFGGATRKCSQHWDSTVHQHWEGYQPPKASGIATIGPTMESVWTKYRIGLLQFGIRDKRIIRKAEKSKSASFPPPYQHGEFRQIIGFDDGVETGFCEMTNLLWVGKLMTECGKTLYMLMKAWMRLGYDLVFPLLSFQLTRTWSNHGLPW